MGDFHACLAGTVGLTVGFVRLVVGSLSAFMIGGAIG